LTWRRCDCCGAYRRKDKLRKPKSEAAIGHHHLDPARAISSIFLCSKCHSFKPTTARPWCSFSPKNLFPQLNIPASLQDLTLAEKEVIRLVHPFQALLVLPKGQQGSRGQVIHLPASPVEKLRQLLPADPHDVLLVAQEKLNGKTSTFTRLRVEKVLASLKFLKAHNLRYSHIEIREEGEIKALFDKWERGLQQLQKDEDLPQHQKEGKQTNKLFP